jgi:glycerol-3-phosphate cytidylyltransferase
MFQKILYTGGTFDMFHYGHINFLHKCSNICKNIIVSLNSDEFIFRYKKRKPIMSFEERRESLLSCSYVKSVIKNIGDEDSKQAISVVQPNIIAVGDDWINKNIYDQMNISIEWLKEKNIELVFIPYTKQISTSQIISRIISNE